MEKLRKAGRHTLDSQFGNCISCGACWEAAEDHECRPNHVYERFVAYAAKTNAARMERA